MQNHLLIGIDIGTQGTKTLVFDTAGRARAEAFEASQLLKPTHNAIEENPEKQVASAINTIKKCLQTVAAKDIKAIALAGQMAGIVGVGKDGRNVTPYDSWLDTRCAPQIEAMKRKAEAMVLEKTGSAPSFNHGPKKLWWQKEHPSLFQQIKAFVQPSAHVAMRLCGLTAEQAFIDKTYLHFSGFADNPNAVWDKDLCKILDFPMEKLPHIVEPHDQIGTISREMAALTGLLEGTPVMAGCGDSAASFLAAGATRKGVCVDIAGTASVFCSTVAAFQPDTEHRVLGCSRAVASGLWHHFAYINGGGQNLEWFKNNIASGFSTEKMDFDLLNEKANEAGFQEDNPLFIPHLGGRVCPSEPYLRGAWIDLNWSHHIGHLFHAVLEGVALEYGIYLKIIQSFSKDDLIEMRITGGGSSSDLWNQIKADALGLPILKLSREASAPMGAALIAGFGVGLFKDYATTVQDWMRIQQVIEPTPPQYLKYQKRIKRYEKLMKMLNELEN